MYMVSVIYLTTVLNGVGKHTEYAFSYDKNPADLEERKTFEYLKYRTLDIMTADKCSVDTVKQWILNFSK